MVVVVQGRDELVGLAAVEAVPAVEAAPEGPRGPRVRHVGLAFRSEVPLPNGIGGVAGVPQHLGEETVLPGRPPPVAGISTRQVGHAAHAAAMVVSPGQQARPRRRAQRCRVEVGQSHPVGGDGIDEGGLDVGPVATELGEADVVEHDEDHIGRALWRSTETVATMAPSHASRCRSFPGTSLVPRVTLPLVVVPRASHSGHALRTNGAMEESRRMCSAIQHIGR